MVRQLFAPTVRRGLCMLAGASASLLLSGCCGYFSFECAPQQPASITANQNVESFTSARDQVEGLLAAAHDIFTDATMSRLSPQYTAAANSANAWIDYASGSLKNGGTFDAAQSARRLDEVLTNVSAFTGAVEADAGVPANFRVPFTPLPASAVLDQTTGASPIVAAAEQVRNGVAAGVDAILAVEGPIGELDQSERARIAQTLSSVRWQAAEDVLTAPSAVSAPNT